MVKLIYVACFLELKFVAVLFSSNYTIWKKKAKFCKYNINPWSFEGIISIENSI